MDNSWDAEVVVRTEKAQYLGGDVVYGSVYARFPTSCSAQTLKLVLRGHELSEFDYQYVLQQDQENFVTKLGRRKARKDILKREIKLAENTNGFQEGCFAYPFQFQLPHGLPGVFSARYEDVNTGKVWEGVTKYSLGVALSNPENPANHQILGETSLFVLDGIECVPESKLKLESHSDTGSVKTFFCISRGDVKVTSSLHKAAYSPMDKLRIHLNVENGSSVDVTDITVKVIRVIKLLGLDKQRDEEELMAHTVYDTICEITHEGCPKNSKKKSSIDLDLSEVQSSDVGLPASCSGSLNKCSYVIDIDAHLPWAPDIEVRQPLIITPGKNDQWLSWVPAKWVADCSQQQVTGIGSVPPDILVSQSFSGLPSFQPLL